MLQLDAAAELFVAAVPEEDARLAPASLAQAINGVAHAARLRILAELDGVEDAKVRDRKLAVLEQGRIKRLAGLEPNEWPQDRLPGAVLPLGVNRAQGDGRP